MLIKFESSTGRVKGLCFHCSRSWILVGLHSGSVQIWDYRLGTLMDKFDEHEGPVRGVDFHFTQPLFCTGGDDYKVKVWNYKTKRCLFSLIGHLDYIRTVSFHREQPWIVSASDDQTLRLWNWQSRICMSVLTGHNHYVMCAQFHPSEDLIVSGSLDQTIRVWDISALKSKRCDNPLNTLSNDFFGTNDAMTRCVLEGHEKGVNWVSFHPTKPLIVSASDDRTVRIWKLEDSRAYEVDQLRGHTNNVSCVTYYKDLIISNAEDRTTRVWDSNVRTYVHLFRRENDRYWTLTVHPGQNLIAAGHDSGFIVFKLEKERPAFCILNQSLYLIKDRSLRCFDFMSSNEITIHSVRRHPSNAVRLQYNDVENVSLLTFDCDGGFFELYASKISRSGASGDADVKKGFYTSAVFISRNKFAVLDKNRQILVKNLQNEIVKLIPPVGEACKLFPAPQGFVLCGSPTSVALFDISQKQKVAECTFSKCRYVVWSKTHSSVALWNHRELAVGTRDLLISRRIQENNRIKSAVFSDQGNLLIFSTYSHIKYLIVSSGEIGTLKCIDHPIYLAHMSHKKLWFINRAGTINSFELDMTEINIKLALNEHRFKDVFLHLRGKRVHGKSLVAYLHRNHFSELAIHFIRDPDLIFNLSVECGNLEIAKEMSVKVNKKECWARLAQVAWMYGQVNLVCACFQTIRNFTALSFTHLIRGDDISLRRVINEAQDPNLQFNYAVVRSDYERQINDFEAHGHYALALILAYRNGYEERAIQLEQKYRAVFPHINIEERLSTLREKALQGVPFSSLCTQKRPPFLLDWPSLPIQESYVLRMLKEKTDTAEGATSDSGPENPDLSLWGNDLELNIEEDRHAISKFPNSTHDSDSAWGELNLDIDPSTLPQQGTRSLVDAAINFQQGHSYQSSWAETDSIVHQIASGNFERAISTLKSKHHLDFISPLQIHFMRTWIGSTNNLFFNPLILSPMSIPIGDSIASSHCNSPEIPAPRIPISASLISALCKEAQDLMTDGKFAEARMKFVTCMHLKIFLFNDQAKGTEKVFNDAREYIRAIDTELSRKESKELKRQLELAAYFTHFKLNQTHSILSLRSALAQMYKAENFGLAVRFAQRLLDFNVSPQIVQQAEKVIACQKSTNSISIDYHERNPFTVCSVSKTPIYKGTNKSVQCEYCGCEAHVQFKNQQCPVCGLARLNQM